MAIDFEQTVFVVDDDPGVLDAADEMVRAAGMRARCFQGSLEFLQSLSVLDIGCVVLDLRIPDLDGFGVLEQLKKRQFHLPAIMMTGYGDVPTAVRAMKQGALTFLEKPFQPQELLAEICKAVALVQEHAGTAVIRELAHVELSDSERSIISGLICGRTDIAMAAEFDVSRRTVQHWKRRLFDKVGVSSRQELLERLFRRSRPMC